MKKCYIVFCMALLLTAFTVHAQTAKGILKGRLADTSSRQVLRQATIKILNPGDSSVVREGISDDNGRFVINTIPKGTYTLQVKYSGYDTRYQSFKLTDSIFILDAGNIYMQLHENALTDVVVEAPPIVIKADTTEFNAQMFHVKPNSTAADLLQKLPGVDVDAQGNIKAQGETVQRVLVNGKRFFGDDPKMATQNLPSDVIDKIQTFDDLSDQSKFTGFDDGNRVKTINIITKKNMNNGYFGKVIAGVADKGLYDEAANISKFDGNEQITFIGQANNTNKQNFTVQDILGSSGGGGVGGAAGANFGGAGGNRAGNGGGLTLASPTGANGLTTTWAGGLNYRNTWGKTEAYGSYFYNNLNTVQDQKSSTEDLLQNGDTSLYDNQTSGSTTRKINQRVNLNIETSFDSANSMVIRPNGSYQTTTGISQTNTTTTRGLTTPVSSTDANTNTYGAGYNGSADILFRHKFAKKGRTFSIDLNLSGNTNDGNGLNYSSSIYNLSKGDSTRLINQYYTSNTNTQGISPTFSYTEPIGKKSIIELNYNYAYNKTTADRYTYDFDSSAKGYTSPDALLTNTYLTTYYSNRATLSYRYQNTNLNFSIGNGVQFGNLSSINTSKVDTVTQHYTNIYPTANLTWRITRTQTLKFNYTGRTSQPSATQLEPIINNSDPNNIQIGNPGLKQTFTNNFRLLFTSFDNVKFTNMFASINASFVGNNIVNKTITNTSTGVDSITPVNLNGTYNLSAFFNYGFPLKKPKSNLNFTTNVSETRGVSMIGTDTTNKAGTVVESIAPAQNFTSTFTAGETIKWTTNLKDNFDVNFSGAPTYNIAHYSQNDSSIKYFSFLLTTEATWFTKSGWILTANLNYTYYGGRAAGYNTSVPLLNAGIAKQFLKNKRGELRLTVYDVLNQNVSITRNVTPSYVQDVQTKVLTRYALLTFTYNLRNFPQQQGRRGGGGRGGFPGGGGGGFRGGGGPL